MTAKVYSKYSKDEAELQKKFILVEKNWRLNSCVVFVFCDVDSC